MRRRRVKSLQGYRISSDSKINRFFFLLKDLSPQEVSNLFVTDSIWNTA